MKKQIAAILIGCTLTLTACGSADGEVSTETTASAGSADTISDTSDVQSAKEQTIIETVGISKPEPVQIALVTSSGGLEDESFNQSAWEGLQRAVGTYGCEPLYAETRSDTTFKDNLDNVIAQGGDLCWGIGYSCAEDMLKAAQEHPEISFAIIDNYFEDTPDNMTGVMFRAEESSFLVGYIAACVSETGKIGFVGGMKNEVIEQFRYGYMAGAYYADKENGKTTEVLFEYSDTFSDSSKGKVLADTLYDNGCDVVFHAAGETGLGVIESAKEHDLYVIGADKDQSYLAPENVIASAEKFVSVALYSLSGQFISGENIGGQTVSLGLAENAVGISSQHSLYSDEIYNKMLVLKDEIIAGTIVPPTDEESFTAFAK
ncbi:MAG: BMP family ABC transporter substrate-binding protein [Lachnospiraceae bacterium]|nr:BMP family ABC transporter substrate-binding protein [Lachnospiraceae bacterium]